MATTDNAKNSGTKGKTSGRTRSAAQKAGDAKRSASQRGRSNSNRGGANGRRGNRIPNLQDVPAWATTLASVVGVGVAVGVGLFATRKQWMPQAEEWGDQLHDRFGKSQDDEDDDFYVEDDGDDWESGTTSAASFPGTNTGATAAGAV